MRIDWNKKGCGSTRTSLTVHTVGKTKARQLSYLKLSDTLTLSQSGWVGGSQFFITVITPLLGTRWLGLLMFTLLPNWISQILRETQSHLSKMFSRWTLARVSSRQNSKCTSRFCHLTIFWKKSSFRETQSHLPEMCSPWTLAHPSSAPTLFHATRKPCF